MCSQVWLRPLVDAAAAVVLFNPGDTAASITVEFRTVPERGWTKQTLLQVRDLWQKKDLGAATGHYTAQEIPSHGSVFLKLTME